MVAFMFRMLLSDFPFHSVGRGEGFTCVHMRWDANESYQISASFILEVPQSLCILLFLSSLSHAPHLRILLGWTVWGFPRTGKGNTALVGANRPVTAMTKTLFPITRLIWQDKKADYIINYIKMVFKTIFLYKILWWRTQKSKGYQNQ